MSKSRGKAIGITIGLLVVILGVGAFAAASTTNLLANGTYYTKIDNAHVEENDSSGSLINLRSGEPYIYTLPAVKSPGEETEIEFGSSRELRQDAYLKLEIQPVRGVVSWEEVSPDDMPSWATATLR